MEGPSRVLSNELEGGSGDVAAGPEADAGAKLKASTAGDCWDDMIQTIHGWNIQSQVQSGPVKPLCLPPGLVFV